LMLATTIHKSNTTPHHQDGATTPTNKPGVISGPNSVSGNTLLLRTRSAPLQRTTPHGSHPT